MGMDLDSPTYLAWEEGSPTYLTFLRGATSSSLPLPSPNRMTDTFINITFPHTTYVFCNYYTKSSINKNSIKHSYV